MSDDFNKDESEKGIKGKNSIGCCGSLLWETVFLFKTFMIELKKVL